MNKNMILISMVLALAACSGGDNHTATGVGVANTKQERAALSSDSAADIKADLKPFNQLINQFNTQSLGYQKDIEAAVQAQDEAKVMAVMSSVKEGTERLNTALMNLACQSKEVNDVRIKMMDGNMRSVKLIDLGMKKDRSEEDNAEMTLLSKQSVALQRSVGQALDTLNATYPQ